MSVTAPAGITCANYPPPLGPDDKHQHCVGDATVLDPMDLAPGAGITLTVTVTGVGGPDVVSLDVNADIFNTVAEFSESNNIVTETTIVTP